MNNNEMNNYGGAMGGIGAVVALVVMGFVSLFMKGFFFVVTKIFELYFKKKTEKLNQSNNL
ncbi:MAG TPA: hypothetical protein VF811_11185 [Parasulfuritortus sp.]